jgi:hypothetical protein
MYITHHSCFSIANDDDQRHILSQLGWLFYEFLSDWVVWCFHRNPSYSFDSRWRSVSANFSEANNIRNRQQTEWRHRMQIDNSLDPIFLLPRRAKTSIFCLCTGHCKLRAHLHRLGLIHTDECSCWSDVQSTKHFLQECSTHREFRQTTWPQEESVQIQLWGSLEDLERTAGFILAAGKTI